MTSRSEHYRVELAQTNSEAARKAINVTHELISAINRQRSIELTEWKKVREIHSIIKKEGIEVMRVNKHLKNESAEMMHIISLENKRNLESHHLQEIQQIRKLENEIKEDINRAEKLAVEEEGHLKRSIEIIEADIQIMQSFLRTLEASKGKSHYSHAELDKLHSEYSQVHRDMTSRSVELRAETKLDAAQKELGLKIQALEKKVREFYSITAHLIQKERKGKKK